MSRDPMISCILMPRSRRWIASAIRWFIHQQCELAELMVIDDSVVGIGDLVPADNRIRYIRIERSLNSGDNLNFACSQARGEIIAHWQEAVWYATDYLLCLVNGLSRCVADIAVVDPLYVYDLESGKGWKILDQTGGNGLAYRRACWQERPFDQLGDGEIERFVAGFARERIAVLSDMHSRLGLALKPGAGEPRPYPAARLHALPGRDARLLGLIPAPAPRRHPHSFVESKKSRQLPHPLASALLLARDSRLAAVALDGFLNQDYEPRELIIVDDGCGSMEELACGDGRIRCVRPDEGMSDGAKRNLACSVARGKIILHWDEAAWRSSCFMRYMIEKMVPHRADICYLSPSMWYDPASAEAWQYHHPMDHGFRAAGGALCYRRKIWEKTPFPDTDTQESLRFVWNAPTRRLLHLPPNNHHVFIAGKHLRFSGPYWQPFSSDRVREILGSDSAAYEVELPLMPSRTLATNDDDTIYSLSAVQACTQVQPLETFADSDWVATPPPPPLFAEHTFAWPARGLDDKTDMLVSCIMPTFNRRRFVPLALAAFLRQNYEPREMIVVDDGTDPVQDLMPADSRIRYIRLNSRLTVGAKRNLACEQARGDIIVHWDDDDWHAPFRLRYQVDTLLREMADLCGMNPAVFFDLRSGKGWIYEYPQQQFWAHGSTFCYRRSFWERNRFAEIDVGEDNQFIWHAPPDSRMIAATDRNWHVSMVHECNVSPKSPGGGYWQPFASDEVRRAMGRDWQSYANFLPVQVARSCSSMEQNHGIFSASHTRAHERPAPLQLASIPIPAGWYDEDYFETGIKIGLAQGYHWDILQHQFRECAQFLVDAFPEAQSFIDAGCATGFLVRCLREAGKECWGFDHSSWAIEHADPAVQPFLTLAGVDHYRFERPFDLLLLFDLLTHLTEHQAFTFLSRARHWIRGAILAAIPNGSTAGCYMAPGRITVQTRQWWHDLLVRAGWRQDFLHKSVERNLHRHPLPARLRWDLYLYAP